MDQPSATTAEPTNSATPQAPQNPQPQQVIDTADIIKRASEAASAAAIKIAEQKASEMAATKLAAVGRALSGESAVDPSKQFLETFVTDPLKAFHSLKEVTKKELREENDQISGFQKVQRDVVTPFINEYPELNSPNKLGLVEKIAEMHERSGKPYQEALKLGCEEAIKEFGLKSVTEAERTGHFRNGLPSGGGFRSTPSGISEEKSEANFLTGMRSRLASFRNRKS